MCCRLFQKRESAKLESCAAARLMALLGKAPLKSLLLLK